MSWSMAAFTFLNCWWVMLFFVMPVFVTARESGEGVAYAASPTRIRWKKALIVNTLCSLAATALFAFLIHIDVVPLHGML